MAVNARYVRVLGVLLAVIFLGAQFHYCADFSSGPTSTHICPLCSTAGVADKPASPIICTTPVNDRLDVVKTLAAVSLEIPQAVSPRAPPAL